MIEPSSPAGTGALAEESRRLAVRLRTLHAAMRCLQITSPSGGEGTTTVALELARALAEDPERRVLLVDANLRSPAIHRLLGLELGEGVRDWDGKGALPIRASGYRPNLFVLTAGAGGRAEGWSEQFGRLGAVARQVREEFDMAVFDTPPVARYPDALGLAPHVDAMLVVVAADETRLDRLAFVREELGRMAPPLVGAVLNRTGRYLPRLPRQFDDRKVGRRKVGPGTIGGFDPDGRP